MEQVLDNEPIIEEATGINVARLTELADFIQSHPEEFDMDSWTGRRPKGNWFQKFFETKGCTTTHCIAGWTCALFKTAAENIPAEAQTVLELTYEQADRLFYWNEWPEPFQSDYAETCPDNTAAAWVAAERIRHFIATNGAE